MILDQNFYLQDTVNIAKQLLGKYLVHESQEGITVGKIVETEAYLGIKDPASHSYKGESHRTRAMWGDPGHAYIYFIYGAYYCFNVTTAPKGIGEAVLIRALEPVYGLELMEERRRGRARSASPIPIHKLCNGPAKLVISMGITKEMYGHDLSKPPLYITKKLKLIPLLPKERAGVRIEDSKIVTTTRVGISQAKEMPLRFYIKDNLYISKK